MSAELLKAIRNRKRNPNAIFLCDAIVNGREMGIEVLCGSLKFLKLKTLNQILKQDHGLKKGKRSRKDAIRAFMAL